MPIDDRTTNRSYKLPNAGNFLADDVQRLRDALTAIDADVFARYTKAETDQKLADLINGAPGALDTLNELAAVMGNDPNFAATITNALTLKANVADVYTKTQADARYVKGSIVSVTTFGAVADGNFATGAGTDNSAAFQSAINSLTSPLNGGKALYIPAGVHKLASQITIPSGVSVIGDGPWNSIVFCPNAFANTGGLIRLNGAGGPPTSVSGLGILAQTGGASGYGLVSVANGVFLDWLWVNGFDVGIQLSQTDNFLSNFASELNTTNLYITETDVNVSNGTVYGGTNGVTVANNSSVGNGRVHLIGVRATTCAQNGFYLGPAKFVDVTGCSASHVNSGAFSASGITVDTSTDVSIVGFNGSLGTTSTTSTGIKVVASTRVAINGGQVRGFFDGISTNASEDISIDAVQSTANGRSGIYLNAGSRIAVNGCTARSNGTAGVNDYGIYSGNTDANSTHTLIGNTCTDVSGGVQSYGIAATVSSASSYTLIDNNVCQNSSIADIYIDGANSPNVTLTDSNIATTITEIGRSNVGKSPIRLGTLQNTTSQTFRDFTGIPSWARRVVLLFNGVSTTGASDLLIQLGVGSTPTTSGYLNGQSIFSWGSGILSSTSTAGIPVYNNAAAYVWSGRVVIERLDASSNNWVVTATLNNTQTSPAAVVSSGVAVLSGVLGMVRLTTASGTPTFDAGSLNLAWE